ncbi:phosphatidylinositol glycan anchor biosynthesis class U protein [Stomoxys calcitrans]|uniref:Phosphatidylinositol glycan anchor biosynthesis class U protein n=1 Tax=Stomoxys calcitrans TaxID=35570 RepID=A0A1I8NXX8_STOCA|nr:phosphatidylinositol glycan anchor biosynthesis class U protein [Stomoxys calcitrans]
MNKHTVKWLLLGGAIRLYLSTSQWGGILSNRVEISTPLNSFKRVQEGMYLLKNNINPYDGDMVHEIPIVLWFLTLAADFLKGWLPLLYVVADIATACILYNVSKIFVRNKLQYQTKEAVHYAKDTDELQYQPKDESNIPFLVLMAYLFNPLSIFNCAGLTSTVFSNMFLSLALYALVDYRVLLFFICVVIEAHRNLYPVVLLAPAALVFNKDKKLKKILHVIAFFVVLSVILAMLNYMLMGKQSWNFVDGTLGFIFFYRDLQPNIGLFWYFFTEMFEHFRTMFLITFQMNATVLYLVPLSLKLRKEPILLATILVGLMSIFRAYPCVGDVAFYLALLPLWKRSWKFMVHNFIVFGFFVVSLCMLPALWHLWIYSGSANANFYFGATLAFSTGQIFLVTDLLFAYVKREFCLYNGQKIVVQGKEAKIVLG